MEQYQQQNNDGIEMRTFTIEVEFKKDKETNTEEMYGTVFYVTQLLLQVWTREKAIEDAYDLEGNLLNKEYYKVET